MFSSSILSATLEVSMYYRIIWAILTLVLAVPSTLLGQTMRPFAKFSLTKETAVRAIQAGSDGDTAVLYVKASTLVETWNRAFDLRLEHREDLSEFIRSLDVSACPTDMGLSRLRQDGTVDMRGWDRKARSNEQCLVKGGRVFASLWCFNTTPNLYLSSVEDSKVLQFESPEPAPPIPAAPTTTNAQVGITRTNPEPGVTSKAGSAQHRQQTKYEERGWWSRNWGWAVGGVAVGSTAVALIGQNNGWWGGRNVTQCVAVNSPGFCSHHK